MNEHQAWLRDQMPAQPAPPKKTHKVRTALIVIGSLIVFVFGGLLAWPSGLPRLLRTPRPA